MQTWTHFFLYNGYWWEVPAPILLFFSLFSKNKASYGPNSTHEPISSRAICAHIWSQQSICKGYVQWGLGWGISCYLYSPLVTPSTHTPFCISPRVVSNHLLKVEVSPPAVPYQTHTRQATQGVRHCRPYLYGYGCCCWCLTGKWSGEAKLAFAAVLISKNSQIQSFRVIQLVNPKWLVPTQLLQQTPFISGSSQCHQQ